MNRFLRDSLLQALMVFAWGCVLGLACIFTAAERINEGFLRFSVVMSFCALLGSAGYAVYVLWVYRRYRKMAAKLGNRGEELRMRYLRCCSAARRQAYFHFVGNDEMNVFLGYLLHEGGENSREMRYQIFCELMRGYRN